MGEECYVLTIMFGGERAKNTEEMGENMIINPTQLSRNTSYKESCAKCYEYPFQCRQFANNLKQQFNLVSSIDTAPLQILNIHFTFIPVPGVLHTDKRENMAQSLYLLYWIMLLARIDYFLPLLPISPH